MYNNEYYADGVGQWGQRDVFVAGASPQAYLSELETAAKTEQFAAQAQILFVVGKTALRAIPSSFALIVTALAICNAYGYIKKLQKACEQAEPGAGGDGGECGPYDDDTLKDDSAAPLISDSTDSRRVGQLQTTGEISETGDRSVSKTGPSSKGLPYERIDTPGVDPYIWSPPQSIFIPSASNSESAADETEGQPESHSKLQPIPVLKPAEKVAKDLPYERISTPGHDPYIWSPPQSVFHPSPTPPGTPYHNEPPPSDDYDSSMSSTEDA